MTLRALPWLILGASWLAACADTDAADTAEQASPAVVADVAGTYRRAQPSAGVMTLSPEGQSWRVAIAAAGIPNGGGTAADCEVQAIGPLIDGRITATLVPFESSAGGATMEDIGEEPGALVIVVADGQADIVEETVSADLCGLGSDLSGTYREG